MMVSIRIKHSCHKDKNRTNIDKILNITLKKSLAKNLEAIKSNQII